MRGNMSERLDIENPFYDNDASASAFGWDFQVNAAIFLFLKYLDEVKTIKVEGKYQDIEIEKVDKHFIYAQAKSVQDGSISHRTEKLEDAIISLAKTPATSEDSLLYISNYSAPIKREGIFNNQVVALKNAKQEREEFIAQKKKLEKKLNLKITQCKSTPEKSKLKELKTRIENIDVENFLVSSIYPYVNTEQEYDKFQIITTQIQELLTAKFGIRSSYILKFVRNILLQWHEEFLCNATIPEKDRKKSKSKEDLLWQIVVIISDMEVDMIQLIDEELGEDQLDEFETYYNNYNKIFYIHQRFSFFNKLQGDLVQFSKKDRNKKDIDFIKEEWFKYKDEFKEFAQYDCLAQEYLIKKCLYKLIKNKRNIGKIIGWGKNDN